MAKLERSSMLWYCPDDAAGHARKLKANGCEQVWIKGGVDNPGLRTVWAQWSGPQAQAYADNGVEPLYWAYIYPESPEVQWDTIKRALVARPSRIICLNAEVEWDGIGAIQVAAWVAGLRAYLAARKVTVERIGFSSVPSWDGGKLGGSIYHAFPYEAFVLCTDFDMPQDYWFDPDQADYENKRNVDNSPVIPILTACGEMTDAEIQERARRTIATVRNLAGFSSWECANGGYQFGAIRRAYLLLPEESVQELTTATRPPRWEALGPFGFGVGGGIRDYYASLGSQAVPFLGYPITEEMAEGPLVVQWFERAKVEWHGDHAELGRVGVELARTKKLTEVQ